MCLGFASKLWSRGGVGGTLDEIRLDICCNEYDHFNNRSIKHARACACARTHKSGVEVMQKAECLNDSV